MIPRLTHRLLVVALALACVALRSASSSVVINEIMYQPSGFPENTLAEYIELHNPATSEANVSGWQFTKGVSFVFPAGTIIPPQGYLVVAANLATFQPAHPGVLNVVGDWTGSLSNLGEELELVNAAGVTQDSVEYASEGDWAVRGRETTWNGWEWQTLAAGGGRSLELRHPAMDRDNGQNWGASLVGAGTPGAANTLASTNIAPLIKDVKHFPAVPKSSDPVTISCELADEDTLANVTATLFWRNATTTSPGTFQSAAMNHDGAGTFSATLPEMANLTIIEFYVQASDATLTRAWPAPARTSNPGVLPETFGQVANCQYQVDNEALNSTDSYYRLILTAAENNIFNLVSDNSDRQFNLTLVVTRGADTTIRYRSSMRIRGNSSRAYQFRPLRVSIPNDDRWGDVRVFNLNPRATHLQYIGMKMFQLAGVRSSDAVPIEYRRNGVESTTNGGGTPDFGKWVRLEEMNGDLVNNHWPEADTGNLYKKVDSGGGSDRYWRSNQPAPTVLDGMLDGWTKQNNSAAGDWSDLTTFFQQWQTAAAPHFPGSNPGDVANSNGARLAGIGLWNGTPFNAAEAASVETVSDLDQWARWFAVMTIIQDLETKIANGVDDDYFVYFAPAAGGQRKMQILAHDLDTLFGLGDNQQPFNYVGLYDATEGGQGPLPTPPGYTFRTLLPLFGTTASPGYAAFRTKYFNVIRELYGTVFDADTKGGTVPNPAFYSFLDNHLAGWVPPATLTVIKNFASARQGYLLGLIGSGATVPPPPTSTATVTSTPGTLMISEVLANNVAAMNVAGAFPDIIELYNAGPTPANLAGRSITDDPAVPAKYVFPVGTTINVGSYLILYADNGSGAGHLSFALNNGGEGVYLFESVANGGALIDSIVFGVQAPDYSIGRTGAGRDTWALCTPTLGGVNLAVAGLAMPGSVSINEWLANPDYQFEDDFVELYNTAAQPVALGGMSVTDDFINYPARAVFPQLSFMAPGAFLRLDCKGDSATPGVATELPFNLDSTADWVALTGQNGTVVDRVDIVSHPADTSTGRSPDGSATWASFGPPNGLATPGVSNAAPPANILALMNGLRVTELLYTPTNLEYIELQNIGPVPLDLSGVRFTNGITYTFPPVTMLAPGAFIVICRDRTAFQMQFGGAVPLAPGSFTGSLDNDGEVIAFRPPAPYDANILRFSYDPTWYPGTSTGYSLTVVDAVTTAPRDWGDRATWRALTIAGGSPGNEGPPIITSVLNVASIVGDSFQYQIVAAKSPNSYSASPLPPGLNLDSNTGLINGTPTQAGTFNVTIGATNARGTTNAQLVIKIASSGPLASFAWNTVSSPQQAGVPFATTVTARDAQDRTVASFNGAANISGTIGSGSGATVVLTECGIANVDSWELQNVSGAPVNTAGWFVVMNNPGGINTVYSSISLPPSLAADEIFHRHEDMNDQAHYFGFTIAWGAGGPGWVMLVDNTGKIRDFFAWEYTAAQIATISVTVSGFTLNPVAQGAWSGEGEPVGANLTNTQALLRAGTDNHSSEIDWSIGTASRGVQNTGLTLPFPPGTVSVPVTPAIVSFTNGIFSGNVQVGAVGSSVRLTADDGSGHTGLSNAFDTVPPPPVIISPTSVLGVIGQAFSYQIVATNSPGSYNATNLPNGLTVSTATGLLSGTPTGTGTRSVSLSATNLTGTGNATLTLQVQVDADGDGMGDAWEIAHGLNPGLTTDANLDKDGDGQSNRHEWLAGTAPNDSNSRLRISNEQRFGNDVRITWATVPGKRYRIISRTDLTTGAWIDLTPSPIVATAATTEWTHLNGALGASRYYRVEIVP